MAKQPEQAAEKQLLAQLNTWGYGLVPIKDEKDLVGNLKTQLEKHNQIRFSEKEIEKVLNLQRPAIGYRVDHGPILLHPIEGATISKTRCVSSENFASFTGLHLWERRVGFGRRSPGSACGTCGSSGRQVQGRCVAALAPLFLAFPFPKGPNQ